ncbi:VOC family protein [Thiothrix winogradskyi]|uniref:VOC family protein n=1 Tax=Thiothrix winogradskyi TaxID=96472 RepID=A0ABY3T1M3_9GAMM|nr:VOC family protein [Thiothrix winogradskyi]UJS24671.1 VOC family protein [Thiothrix winogradskyi]
MSVNYKPDNYSTVSPYLIVDGASDTIAFLETVFDAIELRRFPNDEGKLLHSEVRLGDSVLMIADRGDDWEAVPAHVHIYVPDVDATYQWALAAGATAVQAPVKKDDPDKRGGVKDAGGTTWWIATRQE